MPKRKPICSTNLSAVVPIQEELWTNVDTIQEVQMWRILLPVLVHGGDSVIAIESDLLGKFTP